MSPSRSNLVLLGALLILTLAGSSVFIYAAGVAEDKLDLGPLTVSFAYSLNAAAGVAATRLQLMRTGTVVWYLVIAASVVAVGSGAHPVVFYVGMTTWGFGFWMTVPRVLHMLAERSLSPDERVGDAQAGMAIGRAMGPLMGAPLASAAAYPALGGVAAAGTMLSGIMVAGVQVYRRTHLEPTSPPLLWRL